MRFATLLTLSATLLFSATPLVCAQSEYSNTYMTCLVNKARRQAGLSDMGMDSALTDAAQIHSDDMARSNNMDHTGSDGSSPGDRCQRAGFQWTAVAENIAYGQNSMDEVMQVWMDSPGHRENILNPQYTMFGSAVGYSGSTPYYTQTFASDGQAARNIPTCDGSYPDMSTPSQSSSGGRNKESSYGGNNDGQTMKSTGGSYGGRQGGRHGQKRSRKTNGGSFGHGGRQSGSDYNGGDNTMMSNDDDWFANQGFGQKPFGKRYGGFGDRGGMFSGNGGFDNMFGNNFGQNFPGFGNGGFGNGGFGNRGFGNAGFGGQFGGGFGGGFGGFY